MRYYLLGSFEQSCFVQRRHDERADELQSDGHYDVSRQRRQGIWTQSVVTADHHGCQDGPAAHHASGVLDGRRLPSHCCLQGGAPTNPDWYVNLLANPIVTVELGAESFQAR